MNSSAERFAVQTRFTAGGRLKEWDPATGEVRPVPSDTKTSLYVHHGKVYRSGRD